MEEWRPVPGYEGRYEVSNLGRCRSWRTSQGQTLAEPLIKGICRTKDGYSRVSFYKENTNKRFFIHRLVALVFIHNPDEKKVVNHKNGIKSDNRAENLEWVTDVENKQHAWRMGLIPRLPIRRGQASHRAILNDAQVREIRQQYLFRSPTFSRTALAQKYGVSVGSINNILLRRSWKHLV